MVNWISMCLKSKECFNVLSMNGNFSAISILFPFVLSLSKDSQRILPAAC